MGKKVLIVEDDPKISLSLAVRLRAEDLEVTAVPDAVLAMTAAVKERPDLIVLDISLPGGNGFDVADRLSSNMNVAGTPVIFITASKKPGIRERAEELGAVGFFEKPYDGDELMACVRRALHLPDPAVA